MKAKTAIGDIFQVEVESNRLRYFQLIAFDESQLNSDVIRVFKKSYNADNVPNFSEVVRDEVDFYAHCVSDFGPKLKLWIKVGHEDSVGDLSQPLFRSTSDYGVREGQSVVIISENWSIWRINGKREKVGKLEGENRNSEIGLIVNPYEIVTRIKTGKYNLIYPGFE